ncbi:phospholipase C [Celerinatantimonas diazotrophica]|uniref:Phospholipase C n=2 Tax=Celerinatantimonas diazotrophica TaxID=412034 RepID=A0A4R1K438_9GAMM|nr:phospholipase C [Celerinatantimonas diazotrophica]CAG9297517.1 Non-hemolytic phospholipase C [Celerinatantimonas diazotrophica]
MRLSLLSLVPIIDIFLIQIGRCRLHMNTFKFSLAGCLLGVLLQGCAAKDPNAPQVWSQTRATTTPIKHLVVIVDEGTSFDRYFATYPKAQNRKGERVFHAQQNTPPVNGLSKALLRHNPNQIAPYRLSRAIVPCAQNSQYDAKISAYDGGLVDKFVQNTANKTSKACTRQVMGYYDGNTVTALWNYAQHYAMSDNFYTLDFGAATTGAINLIAARSGPAWPDDTRGLMAKQITDDFDPRFDDCSYDHIENAQNALLAPTIRDGRVYLSGQNIGNLLDKHHVSWGWFQGGFAPTSVKNEVARCDSKSKNAFGKRSFDYLPHLNPFQYFESTANPHHLSPYHLASVGSADQANHQYDLKVFYQLAKKDQLPAVSFIKAKSASNGGADYSSPLDEQKFLVKIINQLQKLPQWKHMAIVITYTDSGGFYDHVNPLKNANSNQKGQQGFGPRVPFLAISPYARVNYVDHHLLDQRSIIRFIENNWRLGTLSQGDVADAGSLLSLFDFTKRQAQPLILDPNTGQVVQTKTHSAN